MNNGEYWQKRFELLEQAAHQQGVQCYADIEKQYRQAQKQLEGQIAAWYQRFASNNGVTLAEAKRMLNAKELAELKWDVNQYIQYGQENAINGTWVKQLENASARFHISRLEALKLQTQQSIEVMFGNQLDSIDSTMRNVYKSGYYHTAYEIQKGVGVGWDFSALDDKQISKVINKPWAVDGKNFSERIWGNRQKLVNELNNTLTQNIILGKDPQKAIDEIARKMNTSKTNAGRLVMTEEAFFSSAAQKDCFDELDVEQFEIVATLDSHTSDICRGMDGKHFPMSEWKVGVTAPPFHVHCRSTTVPYFDDEFDAVGERAARDEETGKTYFVPGNMTYKEWEKAFVNGDTGGVNVVIQFFKNLGLTVANIALGIGNAIAALASNMMTAFHNAICSVQSWFYNLLSTALSVIEGICAALNKLPFVEFDYSGISSAADDYAAKASEAAGNKEDYQSISDAFNEGFTTFDAFQDGWASDAFNAGAAWGDGVADKVSNFSLSDVFGQTDIPNVGDYTSGFSDAIANSGVGDGIGNIDDNTGKIKDSLDITEEDLKYLRDIAEQEAINRFTTAEINVDMSGMQNTVNSGDDIDGFMTKLTDSVNEAVDNMTEGVHE